VQHFQLIRGGREPSLQQAPTLGTLDALVEIGLIGKEPARALRDAYVLLRNVEHRLQYLDDAQTHTLPPRDAVDDCERLAAMRARLAETGFDPPDAAVARIAALARSGRLRSIAPATRLRLDVLVPRVLDASATTRDPNATLGRWFDLIEAIAGRSAYLALLEE